MIADTVFIVGAIVTGAFMISKSIEAAAKQIGDRIDNNSRLLDRVGTKLDNLWSPLKGMSNAAWHKLGGAPKLSETPPDDLD